MSPQALTKNLRESFGDCVDMLVNGSTATIFLRSPSKQALSVIDMAQRGTEWYVLTIRTPGVVRDAVRASGLQMADVW